MVMFSRDNEMSEEEKKLRREIQLGAYQLSMHIGGPRMRLVVCFAPLVWRLLYKNIYKNRVRFRHGLTVGPLSIIFVLDGQAVDRALEAAMIDAQGRCEHEYEYSTINGKNYRACVKCMKVEVEVGPEETNVGTEG